MPDPLRRLRILRARLRAVFRHDGVADEIREELEFHLRMRAEGYERAGESAADAARHARERVGNLTVLQDRGYDVRGGGFLETVVQDLRYAARQLLRQPGFTAVAIVTLALGIGPSSALFSVIDAAMLHPLPYPHPEQLVDVFVNRPDRSGRTTLYAASVDDVQLMRRASRSLSDVGIWRHATASIVNDAEPERLEGLEIDEGYLRLFGINPVIGRGIDANDLLPGAPRVVLIGYQYWQRRYAGSREVLGRTIHFDTGVATIVGVLPQGFRRTTDFCQALTLHRDMFGLRGSGIVVYGRLQAGVEPQRAVHELSALLPRPSGAASGTFVVLHSLLTETTGRYWTTVNVLLSAAGLIFLIACVNVAGLLLARGTTRLPEFVIRASIGAGRRRLVRQMLTETLVLSALGGTAGVLLARWSLDALIANIPMAISADVPATMNLPVLATSLGFSIIAGLLFGLAPALRISRPGASTLLHGGRAGSALTRRSSSVLVAAEIALAIVLLAGAALTIRSFSRLMSVDLGFDPSAIVTLDAVTVDSGPAIVDQYYSALLARVRLLPGVAQAGAIDQLPLSFSGSVTVATGVETTGVAIRNVLPGYFEAIGLPLRAGRLPTDADLRADAAVIDQSAAARLFPSGSAPGHEITLRRFPEPLLVVGVVGNVRFWGPQLPAGPVVYRVFHASNADGAIPLRAFTLVIRPSARAGHLGAELRQAAISIGPRVVVGEVKTGDAWLRETVVRPRQRMVLLALLGGLGLLLTLVGVFGVTAYAVARRTKEIGVRMALGASSVEVLRMMLADVAKPVGLGIALGLAGAALSTRIIASFLFETTPTDPVSFAAVAVALAAASAVAAWIPSRRALRVDPVRALRVE